MEDVKRFASKDYARSRWAYMIECAFEYFVALLVADSFLSKVLTTLGFTDAQTGLIASFISLAFLFQLLAVPVVQKIRNVKRFSSVIHLVSQLLFMSLYLVPFLPGDPAMRRTLAVVCLMIAYAGNYLVTSIIYRWGNSFVEPHKRAVFGANKEMISLVLGVAVSLTAGYVMDHFELSGRLYGGFLFAAVSMTIFSLCDFICLMLIRNETAPREEKAENREPVAKVMGVLLKNRNFMNATLLHVLWDVALYLSIGFMGTFKLNDLLFTVGQVQIFNLVGCLGRTLLSRPFGRYSDRHSFAAGVELALIVALIAFVFSAFTSGATRYFIVIFTLLYNICMAGMSANLINMTYSYVDQRYFVQANALKSSVAGLSGFLASLMGSAILSKIQAQGNQLWGIPVYGQQVLSAMTIGILAVALLFSHFVIRRQHVIVQ